MDDEVEKVRISATQTQQLIYEMLSEQILLFETENGKYKTGQSYAKRIAIIEGKMNAIIGENYTPAVRDYLSLYNLIEQETISQQKAYNDIDVPENTLTPARQAAYDQSKYYLIEGLADAYKQPAKFMLMQHVTNGSTIKQMQSTLRNWDKGQLQAGELASSQHAPRLQAYATQIARDTVFTYQGTTQKVISNAFGLKKFIYVGGLVKDSRPFCKHLVSLRRKIDIEEIPELVIAYPQGLKPDTTKDNFFEYRGGFNCIHTAMAIK